VPERLYTIKETLLLGAHPRTIQKLEGRGKIRF